MTSENKISIKTIGMILEAFGVPILIIVAVLLKMPNKDLGAIGVLLAVGVCMFFTGLILSHLPQESEKRRKKKDEKAIRVRSPFDSYGCSDSSASFSGACL